MSPCTYCGIAPVQPQVLGGLDDACDFANDPRDAFFTFEVGKSSTIQVGAEIGRPSTCQPRYGPSRNCVGVNCFCDVWPKLQPPFANRRSNWVGRRVEKAGSTTGTELWKDATLALLNSGVSSISLGRVTSSGRFAGNASKLSRCNQITKLARNLTRRPWGRRERRPLSRYVCNSANKKSAPC